MKQIAIALTLLSFVSLGQSSKIVQHKFAQTFEPSEDDIAVQNAVALADLEAGLDLEQQTVLAESSAEAETQSFDSDCWKTAYGRGVGKVISTCPSGYTNGAGICYGSCKAGFSAGAATCWQSCPSGFTDNGAWCLKPPLTYGRGVGKLKSSCGSGCESCMGLYYKPCDSGYSHTTCNICQRSVSCPSGMTDIGISCQKGSYLRATTTLQCAAGLEYSAGLCYPSCKAGYTGVGPVCWKNCPAGAFACGAFCATSSSECTAKVITISTDVMKDALNVAVAATGDVDIAGILEDAITTAQDLTMALC